MRLLITLDFPPEKGGIQRYLSDIVVHTYTKEDLVISGDTTCRSEKDERIYPCRIIRVARLIPLVNKKMLLIPILFIFLYQIIRNRNLSIFAGNIYAAFLPCCISFFIPVRYCLYCYGTELLPLKKKNSLYATIWKMVLRRAETAYYLTNTTRRLLEICGSCTPLIRMVPRIDLPDYKVGHKRVSDGVIHLLSVGRLVPHKGHALLIEAVAMLPQKPDWRLTIVGDGPEYRKLNMSIRLNSLENKILLAGQVSDLQLVEYYKKSHIFIFPSIETPSGIEGFGIALLEAMAYGVAIIASKNESSEEVFGYTDRYAELVDIKNPAKLMNAVYMLMTDGNRRFDLACAARRFLEERYVWERP